jgi:hypothetical protein
MGKQSLVKKKKDKHDRQLTSVEAKSASLPSAPSILASSSDSFISLEILYTLMTRPSPFSRPDPITISPAAEIRKKEKKN